MGTKFGNVHVRTERLEEVVSALRESSANLRTENDSLNSSTTGFEHLLELVNQTRKTFYIGEIQQGWFSILNDNFGWGEAESFGENLSSYITSPVMTVSYFDDDLFELNVYANGEQTTGQLWCSQETLDVYGLEDKRADLSILSYIVGHQHTAKLQEILNMEDCEEAIHLLEETIQIPLWIHSDWFSEIIRNDNPKDKEWIAKYEKYVMD